MSERIVNIYADGKLAYTGPLTRAAARSGVHPLFLKKALDENGEIPVHQPKFFIRDEGTPEAEVVRIERAKEYVARFAA
jgi:hypothetical protein